MVSAFAESPAPAPEPSRLITPACTNRWTQTKALKALDQWKGAEAIFAHQAVSAEARAELDVWSTDLLLHLVLLLQQEVGPACPKEVPLAALVDELEAGFLRRLGLDGTRLPVTERDTAFRAFLATREDLPALGAKLKVAKGKTALDLARAVYGHAEVFRGSVIVASQPIPKKLLDGVLKSLCPGTNCDFWDSRAIFKVLITEHGGLAAYVPETASLVLSRSLVAEDTSLHRLILSHELAHAGARKAAMVDEKDWVGEFAAFSGWGNRGLKPVILASSRNDALTRLSKKSSFSMQPDPVIRAMEGGGKKFEGFPLGRTLTRVTQSGDLAEDFADTVAAYVVVPDRFCFKQTALAPGKYAWIGRTLFGKSQTLSCKKKKRRR